MASVAEDFRKKFAVPGLSMAIAQNGRLAYEQAFVNWIDHLPAAATHS